MIEDIFTVFIISVILSFPFISVRAETGKDGRWRPKYADGTFMSKKKAIIRIAITELFLLIAIVGIIHKHFFS